MKEYKVSDIQQGYFFSQPAYLDKGFVLLSQEMPFTAELRNILNEWEWRCVLSDGEPLPFYNGKAVERKSGGAVNDADQITAAQAYIDELEKFTAGLFKRAGDGRMLTFDAITLKVRELLDKLQHERRYLLQVYSNNTEVDDADPDLYNAAHSVRSAIIALLIGHNLKLPAHRLIEVGAAALVHEIGMVRLPPQLYLSSGKIIAEKLALLQKHTIFGHELLRTSDFPEAVRVTTLEHHERENGTGYPRKLSSNKINFYSKIIAVACSYAAITANRPHQDARGGYEGVTGLLRNEGKQYDEEVVRALVFSLSIYPIGQYVVLSDGKKGQVVDISKDPRYPLVQIFSEQTPDGKNRIIETTPGGIFVSRPIDKSEM